MSRECKKGKGTPRLACCHLVEQAQSQVLATFEVVPSPSHPTPLSWAIPSSQLSREKGMLLPLPCALSCLRGNAPHASETGCRSHPTRVTEDSGHGTFLSSTFPARRTLLSLLLGLLQPRKIHLERRGSFSWYLFPLCQLPHTCMCPCAQIFVSRVTPPTIRP